MTAAVATDWGYGADQVLRLVPGLTYRQLDYWRRRGAIKASSCADTGSGARQRWSVRDVHRLRALVAINVALEGICPTGAHVDFLGAVWDHLEHFDDFTLDTGVLRIAVELQP